MFVLAENLRIQTFLSQIVTAFDGQHFERHGEQSGSFLWAEASKRLQIQPKAQILFSKRPYIPPPDA